GGGSDVLRRRRQRHRGARRPASLGKRHQRTADDGRCTLAEGRDHVHAPRGFICLSRGAPSNLAIVRHAHAIWRCAPGARGVRRFDGLAVLGSRGGPIVPCAGPSSRLATVRRTFPPLAPARIVPAEVRSHNPPLSGCGRRIVNPFALSIFGLCKTYPNGVRALDSVTLDIPTGMFGLLGPNGAGKSTLMRTLATLQDADAGSARIGDIDVLRDKDTVRRMLGYLPQDFGVYPKVSAEDMLDHLARLKGLSRRSERRDTVAALLKQVNLYDVRRKALGGFSGGMRQRFGIAQALIGNPQLVIVDEPTAGLDPEERVRFHNLLADIGDDVIVILSTHIVSDVSDLCARMAIIHRGRVLIEGEPATLTRS